MHPSLLTLFILFFLIFFSRPSSSIAAAAPTALPNCLDKCGNITIPYPFGMSSNCYHDSGFYVACMQHDLRPAESVRLDHQHRAHRHLPFRRHRHHPHSDRPRLLRPARPRPRHQQHQDRRLRPPLHLLAHAQQVHRPRLRHHRARSTSSTTSWTTPAGASRSATTGRASRTARAPASAVAKHQYPKGCIECTRC